MSLIVAAMFGLACFTVGRYFGWAMDRNARFSARPLDEHILGMVRQHEEDIRALRAGIVSASWRSGLTRSN